MADADNLPSICILDVCNGSLSLHGAPHIALDVLDMEILYWTGSGAPLSRVSVATGLNIEAVEQRHRSLRDRLGCDPRDLAGSLIFRDGRFPSADTPWARRTMAHLVSDGLAAREPDSILLYAGGIGALTVAEVRELVARIRACLRMDGIGKGDTIAADAAPLLETYLISLAAFQHGVRLVRLNEQIPAPLLDHMTRTVPARMIFTARGDMLSGDTAPVIDLAEGATGFADWLDTAPEPVAADRVPAEINPLDTATIAFTSGSSGAPKGVAVTHEMAWSTASRTAAYYSFGPADIHYSATDLSSNTSQNILLSIPLMRGGTTVLPSREALASPLAFALDCETYGVTCAMTVPSVLRTVLKTEEQAQAGRLDALRFVICTTAPLGKPVIERFRTVSGACLVEAFATRETGTILIALAADEARIAEGGGVWAEMMGRLVKDDGRVADPGEIGELCVQGPRFDHYIHADGTCEPSAALESGPVAGHPGWYRTGDMGRYRENGSVEIVGRRRDIVKSPDGRLLPPGEIEAVLDRSPHVSESCVFRIIDGEGLERVGAAVVHRGGELPSGFEAELRRMVLSERGRTETPVGILILDTLPRVTRNKPDKPVLAEMLQRRLEHDNGTIQ